ncbi:MAG: DUF4097 family beta strand repeat protein [Myxococcales bacterium]|nr:DUF4097 family beta strand repeat protein [Myxococcales bacterium]
MPHHVMSLPLSEKPTLEISASTIDVELVPLKSGELPFIDVHGPRLSEGTVELKPDGEVTRVSLGSPWRDGFEWNFPQKLVFHVPPHVRARVASDAGRLHVEELAGCDLEVTSHAGAVTLDRVRGRLKVRVDSGAVKGAHVGGTLDIRSAAGAVKLGIDALDAGTHQIRTTMGSVKVDLAAGLQVELATSTTLGSVRSRYPNTPGAPVVLQLEAELGAVKVNEVDAVEDERHGDWPDWRRLWRDVAGAVVTTMGREVKQVTTDVPSPAGAKQEASPASQEELRRVLELVQAGKLSTGDAERLIRAMG